MRRHVLGRQRGHDPTDRDVRVASKATDDLNEFAHAFEVALQQRNAHQANAPVSDGLSQALHTKHRPVIARDRHLYVGEHDLGLLPFQWADEVQDALTDLSIVVGHVGVHQRFKRQQSAGRANG